MTLTPSGNKHRKHNCLLTGRQISAEAGIFDANRCRQSRGQVRNRGRDHLIFAACASTVLSEAWGERNPAKKFERATEMTIRSTCLVWWQGHIQKNFPDRFSGTKDIQLPIALSQPDPEVQQGSFHKQSNSDLWVIRPCHLQRQLYPSSLYPHFTNGLEYILHLI